MSGNKDSGSSRSRPSYLPLLNAIAVNERKGEILLTAWADATGDRDLEATLRFVAIREGEHAWAFTKRMCELGYPVAEEDAYQVFEDFEGLLDCVCSSATDAEKVATVKGSLSSRSGRDPFLRFFEDTSIDPATGALLGRYIAEERDSDRRLQAAWDEVLENAGSDASEQVSEPTSELAELRATIKALKKEVKALRRLQ